MFEKGITIICLKCSLECTVNYMTYFKKITRKVQYCPHCGNKLGGNIESALLEVTQEEK